MGLTPYQVYILRCNDDTLYTGIARKPEKRLVEHNKGRGSKYVAKRTPAKIVFLSDIFNNRGQALRWEYKIKKLPRKSKIKLIDSGFNRLISDSSTTRLYFERDFDRYCPLYSEN